MLKAVKRLAEEGKRNRGIVAKCARRAAPHRPPLLNPQLLHRRAPPCSSRSQPLTLRTLPPPRTLTDLNLPHNFREVRACAQRLQQTVRSKLCAFDLSASCLARQAIAQKQSMQICARGCADAKPFVTESVQVVDKDADAVLDEIEAAIYEVRRDAVQLPGNDIYLRCAGCEAKRALRRQRRRRRQRQRRWQRQW